ncbi:MAG TPA: Ig-like domain-containing protein [Candidatus Saccharimonadales bacterium]|nr:Ig-like domain-containing protein [Candidatus Saccharimonadales bacterium]
MTLAGVVGVFVLILIGYSLRNVFRGPFYVVSTDPANKATLDIVSPVSITYNIPVASSTTKNFSISPSVNGTLSTKGDTLTFTPKNNLKYHDQYTVIVSKATSANGKYTIGSYKLTFTAGYVNYNQLPKSQQQASNNATDLLYRQFPITKFLPYQTVHYYIGFSGETDGKLDLQIQLFALYINNNVSMYQQDLQQFQNEALQWLQGNGVNTSTLNITWSPDPNNPATYSNLPTMTPGP